MNKRPLILITMNDDPAFDGLTLRNDYLRRLEEAGARPLLLPHGAEELTAADAADLLELADGLLLSGGDDIEPWRFGQTPHAPQTCFPQRDQAELTLFAAAWQRQTPVFGICRGLQVINVALGGTIFQDLDTDRGQGNSLHRHPSDERYRTQHPVRICQPLLEHILGPCPQVNSHHHQGLDRLGQGLLPAAFAPDGLCEAAIAADRPDSALVFGVQWHPECLAEMRPLFSLFVSAARSYQQNK